MTFIAYLLQHSGRSGDGFAPGRASQMWSAPVVVFRLFRLMQMRQSHNDIANNDLALEKGSPTQLQAAIRAGENESNGLLVAAPASTVSPVSLNSVGSPRGVFTEGSQIIVNDTVFVSGDVKAAVPDPAGRGLVATELHRTSNAACQLPDKGVTVLRSSLISGFHGLDNNVTVIRGATDEKTVLEVSTAELPHAISFSQSHSLLQGGHVQLQEEARLLPTQSGDVIKHYQHLQYHQYQHVRHRAQGYQVLEEAMIQAMLMGLKPPTGLTRRQGEAYSIWRATILEYPDIVEQCGAVLTRGIRI
jgi:hypothetical protein